MGDNAFDVRSLPDCDGLFELGGQIGSGVSSNVYTATEKRSGRILAVKIVKISPENEEFVREECRILTQIPKHENIIDIYDIYLKRGENGEEVWIVMELCMGTAIDFVHKMQEKGRKVEDSHLAHILKGLIQGVTHLHENRIIHMDIRGSNILITKDGEIRLSDFGISKWLKNEADKGTMRVGSPSWMAPETIPIGCKYDNRVDVWATGITAMELADGKAPFEDIHPARALFQISKNPPPSLMQPLNRSQLLNDFINECLEKNPDNRPVIQELLEHPLLSSVESTSTVIEHIISIMKDSPPSIKKYPETMIKEGFMQVENQKQMKMLHEDLAMMENVNEDIIMKELEDRLKEKKFYTFVGDILLALNPYEKPDIYSEEVHERHRFKARSDNSPHIFSVADSAYQDALHHEEPQQILLTGETMSGKTTNLLHILDHLLFLGQGNRCGQNVRKAIDVIHALGNAETMNNANSTRHILQTQISFTATGKTCGAIFWIYQLEKNRVTTTDRDSRNFHIFYYLFYGLQSQNKLANYFLESEKIYEFLKNDAASDKRGMSPKEYAEEFVRFEQNLKDLGFDEGQIKTIRRVLAAILILGEVEFGTDGDGNAKLKTQNESDAVAELLGIDQKKFAWALLKYCVIMKGEATMRYHTEPEAIEAKNVLARGLYFRLVDWIINNINEKLSIPRALYGEKYTINILDLFGFECSNRNTIDQLIINSMNEQVRFFYGQKIFSWEMKSAEDEGITVPDLQFHDNRMVMDQLLSKPDGLMQLIDEATKTGGISSLTESIEKAKHSHISLVNNKEFSVAHYTGKIVYNASEILDKNRDFLPPEMIETLRHSSSDNISKLFTGLLTVTGNLTMHSNSDRMDNREGRWNTGFSSSNKKFRGQKFNTSSKGQYSQSRQMRTAATTFRATCLEILRSLTSNENNIHFVLCIRSNLSKTPYEFQSDIILQQMKAFGVLETLQARQQSYSDRVIFSDFIRRYRFLAFDFNENVEETKENCRLLFIRLKMEGWILGKTKVFLKYYDKEYLSRLYGINVRKIVKVQSMMRAFLARRNMKKKIERFQENFDLCSKEKKTTEPTEENKCYENSDQTEENFALMTESISDLDKKSLAFIKPWFRKWKKQSMYQILLLYRSTQQRNFVYFCQQVHIYNQNNRSIVETLNEAIKLQELDIEADPKSFFPDVKISVNKMPFRMRDIAFFDSSHLCPSILEDRNTAVADEVIDEEWDAPLKSFFPQSIPELIKIMHEDKECQTDSNTYGINEPRDRDKLPPQAKVEDPITVKPEPIMEDVINNTTENLKIENNETKVKEQQHMGRKPSKYLGIELKGHAKDKINFIDKNNDIQIRNIKNLNKAELNRYKTPIREMEEMFKVTDNTIDGDDPPYNFRAMLRKTNHSDLDFKRKKEITTNEYNFTLCKRKTFVEAKKENQITFTEIAPGLIVQGEITDL